MKSLVVGSICIFFPVCAHISLFGQEPQSIGVPHLELRIGSGGEIRRVAGQVYAQNEAVHCLLFLENQDVCRELDLTAEQSTHLTSLLKKSRGRLSQKQIDSLQEDFSGLLLAHQSRRLGQIQNRHACFISGISSFLASRKKTPEFVEISGKQAVALKRDLKAIRNELAINSGSLQKEFHISVLRILDQSQIQKLSQHFPKHSEDFGLCPEVFRAQVAFPEQHNIYDDLDSSLSILGVMIRFVVNVSGEIEPRRSVAPIEISEFVKRACLAIGKKFDSGAASRIRTFELQQARELQELTVPMGMAVNSGAMKLSKARQEFKKISNRMANEAIVFYDRMLTRDEKQRVEQAVWRWAIINRGLYSHLVFGEFRKKLQIRPEQVSRLKKLAEQELPKMDRLLAEYEKRIWSTYDKNLKPDQRKNMNELFGKPVQKLRSAPWLLLGEELKG